MPGLESAKGDNFRTKFKGNCVSLSIVWPQKYKQTVTLGPFYGELDQATMNTTRKAEQVIVTLGKKVKGRWESVVKSGEYASLAPNGLPTSANVPLAHSNSANQPAQRQPSRKGLEKHNELEVGHVFRQYKIGEPNTQRTSRNSPMSQKSLASANEWDGRKQVGSTENSSQGEKYFEGSRSPRRDVSPPMRDELRSSKSPPTRGLTREEGTYRNKTDDKYRSNQSLKTAKGLPLKKPAPAAKAPPSSKGLAQGTASRGPGTPKKVPFIDLGKVSKSPLPQIRSSIKMGLSSHRQSTAKLGANSKAPLSARSQATKQSPRPGLSTKISPAPSLKNSRASLHLTASKEKLAKNMGPRGSQDSIRPNTKMSSVATMKEFASHKSGNSKYNRQAEGSSTDYSTHKPPGTPGGRESREHSSALQDRHPLLRAAQILGSTKLQQRVEAMLNKVGPRVQTQIAVAKIGTKAGKPLAPKEIIPVDLVQCDEDLISLQREVITALMSRLRKEQNDRFECEKFFERKLLQDGKKISDLERVLEVNAASGGTSTNPGTNEEQHPEVEPSPVRKPALKSGRKGPKETTS